MMMNNNAPSRRHNSNYVNDNNNSNIDITVAELNGRNMDDSNNGFSGGEGTGYLMSTGNNNNYNEDDEENFAADYADYADNTTTDDNNDDVIIVDGDDDLVTREKQRERGDDTDESDGGDAGDKDENTNTNSATTYPADCYSFLALYSPLDHLGFWSFGFMVWLFQIAFLVLLVLRVASKNHSTTEDVPNPDDGMLAEFIPANVPALARTTQFFALVSYCIFADESIRDVVTATETFPKFCKAKSGDKVHCMVFSCALRFTQGMLACLVVLLLVVSTTDIVDIVLNFTAVNFISAFDDVAFELAQWGKYGPSLKKEANRIEKLPVPACIFRKYQHVRYRYTVIPIAFVLLACITTVAIRQDSRHSWITKTLRVQFDSDSPYDIYSGCYYMNNDIEKHDKRYIYEGNGYNRNGYNVDAAKFGYCKENRKWFLFKGNSTLACGAENVDILMYSDQTYDFDISVTFEEPWYSRTGTPLQLYFFDDEESLDADQCSSFLGDGVCNQDFNIPSYNYDEGDCCAATCNEIQCGVGTMKNTFNTDTFGDGYPMCKDPSQNAVTIRINNLYTVENEPQFGVSENEIFANSIRRDPLLTLDCGGSNVLTVNVRTVMENQTETVFISDDTVCSMLIKNRTSGGHDIYYVNYTLFHGGNDSIDDDPIVLLDGDSYEDGLVNFELIPDCYFRKLSNYIDTTTIYTASDSRNKAVKWLLEDLSGFSSCEDEHFLERYSLAVINFAAPINMTLINPAYNETSSEKLIRDSLWIKNGRQCAWTNVACKDDSVIELDVGGVGLGNIISGTMATEIGLLKNLTRIDMSMASLFGSIPSEISLWSSIQYINVASNYLTGTIPSEIGMMNLEWFLADENLLTGSIPNEVGQLTNMEGFLVYSNFLTGTVPTELAKATPLEYLIVTDNPLQGTIPSELGQLKEMVYLGMSYIGLSGTIPSSLSQLNNLTNLEFAFNFLTGSVPWGIVNKTYDNFNVYGNQLSNLEPVGGQVICSGSFSYSTGEEEEETEEVEGDYYCNCGSDCIAENGQRCQCEKAQACCDSYIEQNNITKCVVCEGGFSNPDFIVADWDYISCNDGAVYAYDVLDEFGTEEQCNGAKMEAYRRGCVCPGFVPPAQKIISD